MTNNKLQINVIGDVGKITLTKSNESSDETLSHFGETAMDFEILGGSVITESMLEILLDDLDNTIGGWGTFNDEIPVLRKRENQGQLVFLEHYPKHVKSKRKELPLRIKRVVNLVTLPREVQSNDLVNYTLEAAKRKESGSIPNSKTVAVIVDTGNVWRKIPSNVDNWEALLPDNNDGRPNKIVMLPGPLPQPGDYAKSQTFWEHINKKHESTIVVCSASSLRREGALISRRISWERTIRDALDEFRRFETLRELDKFSHLIIRFGVIGIMHRFGDKDDRKTEFVFDPVAEDGIFRDPDTSGRIIGKNIFVVSEVLRNLCDNSVEFNHNGAIKGGLINALNTMQRVYLDGLPPLPHVDQTADGHSSNYYEVEKSYFKDYLRNVCRSNKKEEDDVIVNEPCRKGSIKITRDNIKKFDKKSNGWTFLRQQIARKNDNRVNVGLAIAKYGLDAVLNRARWDEEVALIIEKRAWPYVRKKKNFKNKCLADKKYVSRRQDYEVVGDKKLVWFPERREVDKWPLKNFGEKTKPLYVPIMKFGKYCTVDSLEIESLRSVQNLIKHYVDDGKFAPPRLDKPLSIAVFGPPGTGKSFIVEQLSSAVGSEIEILKYNLTQFNGYVDLEEAVAEIRNVNLKKKIPLVFFDEFDEGNLRWLKYFLAPMQDGTFRGSRQTVKVGRAIFVFAGGVSHSFEGFKNHAGQAVKQSESVSSEKSADFVAVKGPDFVSRLRAHIDVLPIDVPEDESVGNIKPVIRRSIVLRSLIETLNYTNKSSDGKLVVSNVVDEILFALLTIDRYQHGVRSMQAILEMSALSYGKLDASSLPPANQLSMHVNADELFRRIRKFRSISQLTGNAE